MHTHNIDVPVASLFSLPQFDILCCICRDHNSIVAETIEAMQYPRKFFKAYVWGFWPLVFMVVPPGLLLNLAYAKTLGAACE